VNVDGARRENVERGFVWRFATSPSSSLSRVCSNRASPSSAKQPFARCRARASKPDSIQVEFTARGISQTATARSRIAANRLAPFRESWTGRNLSRQFSSVCPRHDRALYRRGICDEAHFAVTCLSYNEETKPMSAVQEKRFPTLADGSILTVVSQPLSPCFTAETTSLRV
jgi:hypothetical protein